MLAHYPGSIKTFQTNSKVCPTRCRDSTKCQHLDIVLSRGLIMDTSSSQWLWEFCEMDQCGTGYLRKISLVSGY